MNKKKKLISVYDMCELAIFTAIAIVLGFFCEIKVGENGGSIGFAMVPIFFIAYRHGAIKGFICGAVIYGLSQCLFDGYPFASYPLDYFFAFGAIGIAGLFRKVIFADDGGVLPGINPYLWIIISMIIVFVVRYLSHVISGVIIWETPWEGSFIYNITYIAPTCFIDIFLMCVLYYPLARLNKIFPTNR